MTCVLLFFYFLSFCNNANSAPNDFEIYFNKNIGFSLRGPEHWFLFMRENGQVPSFFSRSSNLFAIFSKENLNNEGTFSDSDPLILIFCHQVGNKTAMDRIKELYNQANKLGLEIIEPPQEITLHNQKWAVMATKVIQGSKVEFQVFYITEFSKGLLHLQAISGLKNYNNATDALKEYNEERKIFDDTVATTFFGNDQTSIILNSLPIIKTK